MACNVLSTPYCLACGTSQVADICNPAAPRTPVEADVECHRQAFTNGAVAPEHDEIEGALRKCPAHPPYYTVTSAANHGIRFTITQVAFSPDYYH